MDSQRNLLLIALLFVSFMIWQAWQTDNAPQPAAQTTQQTSNAVAGDAASQAVPASGQGKLITVNTDVLSLTINTRGGDIEQAKLLAYPDTLGSSTPFQLLETTPSFVYQAQSGLTGKTARTTRPTANARCIRRRKTATPCRKARTSCASR